MGLSIYDLGGTSVFGGHLLPPSDNAFDLGSVARSWRNLHVQTAIYATSVVGNWSPSADDNYDLGENSTPLEWKDLYIDGIVYMDDASVPNGFSMVSEVTAFSHFDHDNGAWDFFTKTSGAAQLSRFRIPSGTDSVDIAMANANLLFGSGYGIRANAANGTIVDFEAYENGAYVTVANMNSSATAANWTFNRAINIADTVAINTGIVDDDYFVINAVDNDDQSLKEAARAQGAADPYFSMGGSQEHKFYNSGVATLGGVTTMGANLVVGTIEVDEDSGAVTLVDMSVSATPADGTEESISFAIDGNIMLKLYSEADSAGGVDTMSIQTSRDILIADGKGILIGEEATNYLGVTTGFRVATGVDARRVAVFTHYQADDTMGFLLVLAKSQSDIQGTLAYPGADSILGQFVFAGADEDSSRFEPGAEIRGVATELWTSTASGSKLEFYTTDNTTLINDLRLTIDHDGSVVIGGVFKVGTNQVVGARVVDARADDAVSLGAYDATTGGVIDALRDAMVTHGLIAAA